MNYQGNDTDFWSEIILCISFQKRLPDHLTYAYIVDQFRLHQVTSKRLCKSEEEMRHLGHTYLCYLESSWQLQVVSICSVYKCFILI